VSHKDLQGEQPDEDRQRAAENDRAEEGKAAAAFGTGSAY